VAACAPREAHLTGTLEDAEAILSAHPNALALLEALLDRRRLTRM